jgi:PPE-repeat protein
MNNGVFDASAMYNILHYSSQNASGQYVSDVSGSITVSNINSILRFACLNNPFNNRAGESKTVADGFLENDLVYVPSGTTITLVAKIINSDVTPNNIVPTNLQDIISTANNLTNAPDMFGNPDFSNGHYSQTTTFTASQIKRVIQVPLLLVLKNIIV